MPLNLIVLAADAWTWIALIVALIIGGYFFLDKLMRKGIYDESTEGRSRMNGAFSEWRRW